MLNVDRWMSIFIGKVGILCFLVLVMAPWSWAQDKKGNVSCVAPAKGPIVESKGGTGSAPSTVTPASVVQQARVGQPAPDFEANAFVDGVFKNLKLSDYRGKWVVLCFYPGDFTFV